MNKFLNYNKKTIKTIKSLMDYNEIFNELQ
jgi:hypothetical protein